MTSSFLPPTPLQPRKRAILVGACGGLGTVLARKLAYEGWALALISREADCPEALSTELNAGGTAHTLAYEHDVTNTGEVPALLKRIIADLGGLDLIIYNAGINLPPGMEKLNAGDDIQMIEVNLLGAVAWLAPVGDL